jgi:aminoglycoside phosphotransferase (APT) family kinase protein
MGRQRVVVKVAPPGVEPIAHRDVLRQARLIRALGPTAVPVPQVLWEDAGAPPEVPPLFVMSYLGGDSLEPLFDNYPRRYPNDVVAQRLRNAAITMAQLHRVGPASVGLDSEPAVGPEAEIARWCATLETVDQALVPGWRDLRDELRSSVPPAEPPAIVHGDFRLGNLLAVGEAITAVIDWEIWSVGDPRVDAGWFLINGDPRTYRRSTPYRGSTPTPTQLSSIYAQALGRQVADLAWFQALACFKSAATWSLILKHNRRRADPDPQCEAMAPVLPGLLARAWHLLSH